MEKLQQNFIATLRQASPGIVVKIINLLRDTARAVGIAAKLAGPAAIAAGCAQNNSPADTPDAAPPISSTPSMSMTSLIGRSLEGPTINDLKPPRAPLVLPLQNGVATRVSQRAGERYSHNLNSTRHAVDFSDETFALESGNESGLALAPLPGSIHRVQDAIWGNIVELTGRDGSVYISAHCNHFRDEAPEGAFVLRGTPLCRIGNTGSSSHGTHLHFDKVQNPGNPGLYASQGVERYITTRVEEAEPSLLTPDDFQTCCNTCDIRPGSPDCAEYISFNRPLTDTLAAFSQELQRAYPQFQLDGPITPDANLSQRYSPWIIASQNIAGDARRILFVVGTPSGAGQRNPFIDIACSLIGEGDPDQNAYEFLMDHIQAHTPRFVNFDLWDFVNSAVGGGVQFTQRVDEYADWHRDWELWAARFQVNGEIIDSYLAVWKQDRAWRAGIFYRNGAWSGWHWM